MISTTFRPFWKDGALNEREFVLLNAVIAAHEASVERQNISSVTIANAARGSGDYVQTLCAALLTTGGPHAPIVSSYDLLDSTTPLDTAGATLARGDKLPGWGNSFHKGTGDPVWSEVNRLLDEHAPHVGEIIDSLTSYLHGQGKPVFPNPSCYTAAAAIALGIPRAASPFLLVIGRLNGWSKLMLQNIV